MALVKYLLYLYQKIGIFFSPRPLCRYYPSCSHYAIEAFDRFGLLYGGFLAFKRIIRCNQWFPGGYDPLPQTMFHPPTQMFHVKHLLRRTGVKYSLDR